jgi:pyruvate/2-oxoglutarate dehydrogenase complex dihydrolipoamide acyltransferase (E2) component
VPETVSALFVVVASGADPVRTLHDGVVTGVLVRESDTVAAGATLFTIGSEQGDRSASASRSAPASRAARRGSATSG